MTSYEVPQTTLFSSFVRDCMDPPPPIVASGTPCQEVVRILRRNGTSFALVADGPVHLVGVVTDRDIAHRVAFRVPPTTPVNEIMTRSVYAVGEDDYVFHAVALMCRCRRRHLPVLDHRGQIKGMIHLHSALAATNPRFMDLIERLTHEETLPGLKQVKSKQAELVETLARDGVPYAEIQSLLTHVNNDIHRRLLEQMLLQMSEEGWGKPPVDFAVIVMGSGGRGESFLFPDQDNGFILSDYPAEQHATIDAYFYELSHRMTMALNEVGFSLCRGHVMASNPLWRKSLSEWRDQLGIWLRRPRGATLRLSDIFFDFRPVYGDGRLAQALRQYVTRSAQRHYPFLQAMHSAQSGHGVALSMLGRLTPDDSAGPHRGKLNLKYHALLPLVESIRLLGLKLGLADTATLARIASLHAQGFLDEDQQDYLSAAFHHLTALILRQQVRDFRQGKPVSSYVPMSALSERERNQLVAHLQAISALRDKVKSEFTASVF